MDAPLSVTFISVTFYLLFSYLYDQNGKRYCNTIKTYISFSVCERHLHQKEKMRQCFFQQPAK